MQTNSAVTGKRKRQRTAAVQNLAEVAVASWSAAALCRFPCAVSLIFFIEAMAIMGVVLMFKGDLEKAGFGLGVGAA